MRTNVMPNEQYQLMMEEVLEFIADTLSHSLGPKGSNTLIQDPVMSYMTKDGASILAKLKIEESEADAVLKLFKFISRNLANKVGDGSTSSMIVSNKFYKQLKQLKTDYSAKQILQILRIISDVIENYARENAVELNVGDPRVAHIAAIATNNDAELGGIISEAYGRVGKYGFVNYELSKTDKTYYEIKSGFEINGTYCNVLMVNNQNTKECHYKDPVVLMFDECVTGADLAGIVKLMETHLLPNNLPLVVIATDYSDEFHQFVQMNLMQNGNRSPLKLLAIQVSRSTVESREIFEDLSVFLDAGVIKKTEGLVFEEKRASKVKLGHCKEVTAGKTRTTFVGGLSNEEAVKERVAHIQKALEEKIRLEQNTSIRMGEDVFELRKRLASLQDSMATVFVGAHTDFEKKVNMYLVEDAIFAVRSAFRNGYNIGGTLYLPCLINKHGEAIQNKILEKVSEVLPSFSLDLAASFIDSIVSSFLFGFKTVLTNADLNETEINKILVKCVNDFSIYNINTKEYQTVETANVINSVETDIEIMKTMISIIGLMFTSNQMLTNFAERDFKNFGPSQLKARQHVMDNIEKIHSEVADR